MRKQILRPPQDQAPADAWMDLDRLARVEVTSEDPAHPVEAALVPGGGEGWRAAAPGEHVLRIVFDEPQRLHRIWLCFVETACERTQEFALSWEPSPPGPSRPIVRQQWNFSPGGATRETEDHRVDLAGVGALLLHIIPDVRGGDARASLQALRLA